AASSTNPSPHSFTTHAPPRQCSPLPHAVPSLAPSHEPVVLPSVPASAPGSDPPHARSAAIEMRTKKRSVAFIECLPIGASTYYPRLTQRGSRRGPLVPRATCACAASPTRGG